ncbi:10037_t:CDS:2 [Entrophospora sp. SA101]|nr:10037_t:CDS:2 [Entrophospora sp. SA101]
MDMDLDEYSGNFIEAILCRAYIPQETYKHSVLRLAGSKTIVTDDLKDEYFKKSL